MNGLGLKVDVGEMRKLNGDRPTKAFVDVVIDDAILIRGVSVVENEKGTFVGLPRRKGSDEKWYPVVSPTSREIMDVISQAVLEAYNA